MYISGSGTRIEITSKRLKLSANNYRLLERLIRRKGVFIHIRIFFVKFGFFKIFKSSCQRLIKAFDRVFYVVRFYGHLLNWWFNFSRNLWRIEIIKLSKYIFLLKAKNYLPLHLIFPRQSFEQNLIGSNPPSRVWFPQKPLRVTKW